MTTLSVPLPNEKGNSASTRQVSDKCILNTLASVAGIASVLTLYGSVCLLANSTCPPPLPTRIRPNSWNTTTDSTNRSRNNISGGGGSSSSSSSNSSGSIGSSDGINDTGVGLLMIILGVVTLVPVTLVWCVHHGRLPWLVSNHQNKPGVRQSSGSEDLLDRNEEQPTMPSELSGVRKSQVSKHHAIIMLFATHFLSAWGDRMWQFAVPVLFIEMFVDTLAPTALYSLIVYAACVQFMPSLGAWVDREHRLTVQRFALILDNASVVGTSILLCYLAISEADMGAKSPEWGASFTLSFVGIIILGVTGELMNQTQTLSVERDWVVIIAEEMGFLSKMNTIMRRIDLTCKVLAPAAVGAIISTVGSSSRMKVFYGSAAVGLWNALAFPLELLLTTLVFHTFPALECKLHSHQDGVTSHSHAGGHKAHSHFIHQHKVADGGSEGKSQSTEPHWHDTYGPINHVHSRNTHVHSHGHGHSHSHGHSHNQEMEDVSLWKGRGGALTDTVSIGDVVMESSHFTGGVLLGAGGGKSSPCAALARGYKSYLKHPVFLASLSLSLLYCTVLDNGSLMTGYLTWRGVDPAIVGGSRGAGAVFGLIGTWLFPRLVKFYGSVEQAGFYSVWLFWVCLVPGLVMFYVAGESSVSDYTVLLVMVVSRVGLWAFDLSITQILQEYIQEQDRGIINSTQTATMQVFSCVILLGGLIFSEPQQFVVLVTFSIFVVLSACVTYTRWYRSPGNRSGQNTIEQGWKKNASEFQSLDEAD